MCRTTDLSAKSCWNNCDVVDSVFVYDELGLSVSDLGTELSHKPPGNPALYLKSIVHLQMANG